VSATERRAEGSLLAALARADYLSLAAVLGLVLLVYAQLWLPGLVLIKRDAFQLFLPLKQYIFDRLSQGELPLWFPYEGLGRPLISLTVMGVFHPFTLLYWLTPADAYLVTKPLAPNARGANLASATSRLAERRRHRIDRILLFRLRDVADRKSALSVLDLRAASVPLCARENV
jgi:hypothetical protein